jgi:hypothetical protein
MNRRPAAKAAAIEATSKAHSLRKPKIWEHDPGFPGLRLHLGTDKWYVQKRVGDMVLSRVSPFKRNQRIQARAWARQTITQMEADHARLSS